MTVPAAPAPADPAYWLLPEEDRRSVEPPLAALEATLRHTVAGKTLRAATALAGIDSNRFHYWRRKLPALNEAWELARELQAASLFDTFMEEVEGLRSGAWGKDDGTQVRALIGAIAGLQWAMARRDPSQFGEARQQAPGVIVNINTPLDLGGKGAGLTARVQDASFTEVRAEEDLGAPQPPAQGGGRDARSRGKAGPGRKPAETAAPAPKVKVETTLELGGDGGTGPH